MGLGSVLTVFQHRRQAQASAAAAGLVDTPLLHAWFYLPFQIPTLL